jgi:hypothetical protein
MFILDSSGQCCTQPTEQAGYAPLKVPSKLTEQARRGANLAKGAVGADAKV